LEEKSRERRLEHLLTVPFMFQLQSITTIAACFTWW
jgi:hypothetical protein